MSTTKEKTISTLYDTKEKIINAAKNLFSKYGYRAVSMSEIAKEVKITKPALYYHFKNKREIYLETIQKSFEALLERLDSPIRLKTGFEERFRALLTAYLEFSLKEKNPIQETLQKISRLDNQAIKFTQKLQHKITRKFEEIIKEGQTKKKILSNLSSKSISHLIIGIMDNSIIQKGFRKTKKWNPKKSVDEIIKLVISRR